MLFWILAFILVLVVIAIILWPLAGHRQKPLVNYDEFKISVYKHRLGEIEKELADGVVAADQADAAREETEHDLLDDVSDDVDHDHNDVKKGGLSSKWGAALLGLFVVIVAVPVYLLLGSPELARNGGVAEQQMHSVEAMVTRLEQRLEQEPNDIDGWLLLVQSYTAMGRYDEAVSAAERLYALTGDEPGALLRYIHVLVMRNNGDFSGKAEELIGRLLAVDPENTAGLWFAGLAAEQRGKYQKAIDYWNKLVPSLKNEPEALEKVRRLIETNEERISGEAAVPQEAGKSITLKISLAPQFQDQVGPEETVFIFAKAANGPPMPLAAVRRQVRELPLEVTLDDSLAMMPTHKLSGYDKVNIAARISKTGNPEAQEGDLEGSQMNISTSDETPVNIVIDHKVEK